METGAIADSPTFWIHSDYEDEMLSRAGEGTMTTTETRTFEADAAVWANLYDTGAITWHQYTTRFEALQDEFAAIKDEAI